MKRIEITDLACQRGGRTLFSQLDYSINTGQTLRLVGPNGCGKTSLLRTIAGRLRLQHGQILYDGKQLTPEDTLYLDHKSLTKDALTVQENLQFWADIFQATPDQLKSAYQHMGLTNLSLLPAGTLSSGQKKRVQLALLCLQQAPIWLLDEPLLSLDKTYAQRLGDLVQTHLGHGGIVIYASHEPIPNLKEKELDISAQGHENVRHAA